MAFMIVYMKKKNDKKLIRINEKGVSPVFLSFGRWRFHHCQQNSQRTYHDVNGQMTCRLSWILSCKTPSYKPRIREDDSRLRLAPASL